jgi:ubiquitin C-terminal hydrolase
MHNRANQQLRYHRRVITGLTYNVHLSFAAWLIYDDASVRPLKEGDVVDSTAYLLFYRRRI